MTFTICFIAFIICTFIFWALCRVAVQPDAACAAAMLERRLRICQFCDAQREARKKRSRA